MEDIEVVVVVLVLVTEEVVMVVAVVAEEEVLVRVIIVGGRGIWPGIVIKVVGARDTMGAMEMMVEVEDTVAVVAMVAEEEEVVDNVIIVEKKVIFQGIALIIDSENKSEDFYGNIVLGVLVFLCVVVAKGICQKKKKKSESSLSFRLDYLLQLFSE